MNLLNMPARTLLGALFSAALVAQHGRYSHKSEEGYREHDDDSCFNEGLEIADAYLAKIADDPT